MASFAAAAHPAHVDYLYFVRKPDHKHHYFTASEQDFVNHEIQYGYMP
jgi:cell division protein YceG involved in septum cleavage